MASLLPPFFRGARSFQRHAATGIERYAMLQGLFTPRQKLALLTPELLPSGYDHLWFYRQHWRPELHPVKCLQWADLHTYLPEDILTKADRASMAVSLEVRPPLLDHPLVEFALKVHPELMSDGSKGKLLMRRSLDGRVPPGILQRAKSAFTSPIRRWVGQQPELLRSALDRLADAGVIRPFTRGHLTNEQIWSLLFLDRWMERNDLSM
jgi:asparagine synthase (glutamine-hydrolysing)